MAHCIQDPRSRRRFLTELGAAAGVLAIAGRAGADSTAPSAPGAASTPSAASITTTSDGAPPPPWFPRQDPAQVQEVVGVAHRDLAAVRALVEKRPELAKAQWDWGYGDWESPLDAASHTGQREIALLLLRGGARPTIFSAAMLGQLDVVKAFVAASPGIQATPGPHGIPLLDHAKVGGEAAAPVVAYLETLGGAAGTPAEPLDDAQRQRYVGSYRFAAGPTGGLEVAIGRFGLTIAATGSGPRPLRHLGAHAFHPAGAPSVRVQFTVDGERVTGLTIHDPEPSLRAQRLP
jgi:hypothetical protein